MNLRWIKETEEAIASSPSQRGFTLIEMMISLAMGLIILAGISTVFVSESKVSKAISSRTERLADLYLASHLMQADLRESQGICYDGTNQRIIYRPLDSAVALAACDTVDAANGSFQFKAASGTAKPTPYICWDRPLKGDGCQELIRDLDSANGMLVPTAVGSVFTVTLTGAYVDEQRLNKDFSLTFKTWARN